MKYCQHCQQWNHGRPMRCRYCGRTWNVKLCQAGHVNPIDANFCGECGRGNLSEPAERRSPFFINFLKFGKYIFFSYLVLVIIMIIIELIKSGATSHHISLLISIVLLAGAVNFVMKKINLSSRISIRSIYESIVRLYRWISSLRIR